MNRHLLILYCIIAVLLTLIFIQTLKNNSLQVNNEQSAQDNSYKRGNSELQNDLNIEDQTCPINQFVRGINSRKIICSEISQNTQFKYQSEAEKKLECYNHGFMENGFCSCDEGWAGPECQDPLPERDKNAPPDNDKDNVPAPLDCDDNDDQVYPGAPDSIDGKDNNCDGVIDEGY